MESDERNYIKCKCKMGYRMFPSPKIPFALGDFVILNLIVTDVIDGDIKLSSNDSATFKGVICSTDPFEEYMILAEEVEDEKYGLQYDIKHSWLQVNFDDINMQKKFLSKVLTETQVKNLYDTLKDPLKVIKEGNIKELCKVKGIGESTAEKIIEKIESTIDYSKAYIELDGYGLTRNMIEKLVNIYNSPEIAIAVIKENPYKLIADVDGVGFKKADDIALNNGYEEDDPIRLLYLAQYVLEENAENGYSWLDAYDFLNKVRDSVDSFDEDIFCDIISNNTDVFYAFDHDKTGDRCIALLKNYRLEKSIADELLRIKNGDNEFEYGNWNSKIKQLESEQGWIFTDEQIKAIEGLIKHQVIVITGFGGTGKSSTVGAITAVLDNYIVSQTALSGRASARMSEITGEEGYTIHRLLGYNPNSGFFYDKDNQMESDIIVVDEVSMIGGEIFYKLIQAIKTGSKLILLGDIGQLESIGKMNILNDLIESKTIPCYHLTKPHRQALKSGIIESSMQIRKKEQLFEDDYDGGFIMGELQDCFFDITLNKNEIPYIIADYFKELIVENDIQEVQIIVPNNDRGQLCCDRLNPDLQDIYNPYKKQNKINVGDYELRVGDKIIVRKNDYKTKNINGVVTPVFNGDSGVIKNIDTEYRTIEVEFGSKGTIRITKKSLPYVRLGYCITTHSSQGSQYEHVIYGLDYGAYTLLNKEQVYTGISRAKKTCTVCAENKAFRKAVATSEINKKQTFLPMLLIAQNEK